MVSRFSGCLLRAGIIIDNPGKEDSVEVFNKSIGLIEQGKIEYQAKKEMLNRLTVGQFNELTTSYWNLEDQIWHQA